MLFGTAYKREAVSTTIQFIRELMRLDSPNSLLPPPSLPSPISLSLFGVILYIEPRDSSMTDKHYTTELHPQSRFKISQVMEVIPLNVIYMGMSFRFEDETCVSLLTHCSAPSPTHSFSWPDPSYLRKLEVQPTLVVQWDKRLCISSNNIENYKPGTEQYFLSL